MKVKEFIEVLKKFPQDAEIDIGNEFMESSGDHLLGISADSESDDFGGLYYRNVTLCILPGHHQDYTDLIDEKFQLYGSDGVWYNTMDPISTWDDNHRPVKLYYDLETHTFQEKIIF